MFPAAVIAVAKAIAYELPATKGIPLNRWSLAELREEMLACDLVAEVSTTTLWRWLAEDPIKPWQHHSWILPATPTPPPRPVWFLTYTGAASSAASWSPTSSSSRPTRRQHPGPLPLPCDPARARAMRVEHEYQRGGALCYLAAWDVHQARLFGRCEATTGIQPFGRLVEQVMTYEPLRVGPVSVLGGRQRLLPSRAGVGGPAPGRAWPNLTLVHLPLHASWLNQVELVFSVIQRKVLSPNFFNDLAKVEHRRLAFQHRYQQAAVPFDWRFTRSDLDRLLHRLDGQQHRPAAA